MMNAQIERLAIQANSHHDNFFDLNYKELDVFLAKFAELIVEDYAKKTIQGLMSDPAFVQAMDEYYEQKWAHRFD